MGVPCCDQLIGSDIAQFLIHGTAEGDAIVGHFGVAEGTPSVPVGYKVGNLKPGNACPIHHQAEHFPLLITVHLHIVHDRPFANIQIAYRTTPAPYYRPGIVALFHVICVYKPCALLRAVIGNTVFFHPLGW